MTMLPESAFWLALAVMALGLAGTVLPGIPGVPLIWGAGLLYALNERFSAFDPLSFVGFTLLLLLSIGVDLLLSHAVGRAAGASWQAVVAGVVGGVLGFVVGLFIGGIGSLPMGVIGSLAGILLVEYRRQRSLWAATKAGGGWLLGCVVAQGVQFGIGLAMIALFVWQAGLR